MNQLKIITGFACLALIGTVACKSSKSTTSSSSTTSTAPATTATVATTPPSKYPIGYYVAGEEELTAVKAKYPDATMEALKEGHDLYVGTCTGCHKAYSIYEFTEERWPRIIEGMARKARITDAQKASIYKYVFAIKATQPK